MPALRFKVAKLDEVPEAQRPLYKPTAENGFHLLDVEGAADAETLTEFRNNNREFMRSLGASTIAEAKTKIDALKEIDPAEFVRLQKEFKKFVGADGKTIDLEALLTSRTEEMRTTHTKALEKSTAQNTALSARLATIMIDDQLATASASKGILPSAIPDVKLRGRAVFKLEGDDVVAIGPDGKSVLYGPAGKPLTITEWVEKLATEAPHLFEANRGAGGQGGKNGQKYTEANPYSTKTLNRTKQAQLETSNPALAEQLKNTAQI